MNNLYYKIGTGLSVLSALTLPLAARAVVTVSNTLGEGAADVDTIGTAAGISTASSLPEIIGQLISVFLGILGIIFVVLVVYAGFLYLTSQGEEGNVKKAKKLLSQAVIGLIIVISAYAISGYVIAALVTVAA